MNQVKNNFLLRVSGLVVHALANFIVISFFMGFDITGSWLGFFSFFLLCMLLFILFILHVFSFIRFLKSRSI